MAQCIDGALIPLVLKGLPPCSLVHIATLSTMVFKSLLVVHSPVPLKIGKIETWVTFDYPGRPTYKLVSVSIIGHLDAISGV